MLRALPQKTQSSKLKAQEKPQAQNTKTLASVGHSSARGSTTVGGRLFEFFELESSLEL
jgi:hypothetical protein